MGITPIYSIPFADPTDLVRDWPALSEDVAEAVEAAVAGVPVLAGIGSNVVQTVKTDTFTSTSGSFVEVTGLTATITPSSDTSKVLVVVQLTIGFGSNAGIGHFKVTGGNTASYVGDADGSRVPAVFGGALETDARSQTLAASIVFLDAPSSASPVTYSVETRQAGSGTVMVNRSTFDNNNDGFTRGASSITVIEVAA